jgi:hypothetical protein
MQSLMRRVGGAAFLLGAVAVTAASQAGPTMRSTISKGEIAFTSPWQLTPAQFRADLEPIHVPTTCAGAIDPAEVTRVAIKADLYQPGMVTPDSAKFLALCTIPGQITSGEMHAQDGRTMYEVTLIPERRSTNAKVIIDANTGEVLSSKTYGGLRGLAGYLRESVERDENKDRPQTVPSQPQPGVICTLEARPAMQVTVQDENGMPLSSLDGVRVIARKGMYADTATVAPASQLASVPLAYERDGYFSVEVSAPGYTTATLPDVLVTRTYNGCHVVTRELTVRLRR